MATKPASAAVGGRIVLGWNKKKISKLSFFPLVFGAKATFYSKGGRTVTAKTITLHAVRGVVADRCIVLGTKDYMVVHDGRGELRKPI